MGNPVSAKKILGKVKGENELEILADDEIRLQIRLAYMLNFMGAKHSSNNLYKNLENVLKGKKLEKFPEFYSGLALYYLYNYYFVQSLEYFDKSIEILPKDNQRYIFARFGKCDALSDKGDFDEAVEGIDKILNENVLDVKNNKILLGVAYQLKTEYLLKYKSCEEVKPFLDKIQSVYDSSPKTKDYAYHLRNMGIYYFNLKNREKSLKYFLESLSILNHSGTQPLAIISILYWIEIIDPKVLSLAFKLTARTHICFSPYSFLLGKNLDSKNKHPLPKWVEKRYEKTQNDCWLIENNEIRPMFYSNLERPENDFLDLNIGLYKKDGKVLNLTQLQKLTLAAVIGSGEIGIHEYALSDFLYRQNFIDPATGINRLKEILKYLRSKGFNLKKEKGYIRTTIQSLKCGFIIIPMNLNGDEKFNFYLSKSNKFSRKDIELDFGVKTSTASSWIKSWLENDLISISSSGKNPIYSIS